MKNTFTFLLVLLSFVAVSLFSCTPLGPPQEGVSDFELKSVSGENVSLSSLKGKVILLVFGFSSCPYCIKEIPVLKRLHEEFREKSFQVVYVNITEGENQVKRFVEKKSIPYLTLIDKEAKTAKAYRVVGVPTNFLIDKNQSTIEKVDIYGNITTKINSLL